MKQVNCDICGKPFQTTGRGKYCGEDCRRAAAGLMRREKKRRLETQNSQAVIDKNNDAREVGLSYGRYVAMMEK